MEQLVNWPQLDPPRITDSGEGGLSVYFVLLEAEKPEDRRELCLACDGPFWGGQDVMLSPQRMRKVNDDLWKWWRDHRDDPGYQGYIPHQIVDLAMIVGSCLHSIWIEDDGHYFKPEYDDLTPKGQLLFDLLEKIYREKPMIVTMLDT